MKVVIKLGGFLFPLKGNVSLLQAYGHLLKELRRKGHKLAVITGGGEIARHYINIARGLGASEALCDWIGIEVTRLNARLLSYSLSEEAYTPIPSSIPEVENALKSEKIVVMGGLIPGQSTDAVAAIVAEMMKADLLIRTLDIDGIYTADPKEDSTAMKLNKLSPSQLLEMILRGKYWAGTYPLSDPVAVKIIERSNVPTVFVCGLDPKNIIRALAREKVGTFVTTRLDLS